MFSQRLICVSPIEAGAMPKYGHHAVKSPYFDEIGKPKFLDPLIILSKTYALDPSLPPASALILCVDQYPQYSQLKPIQTWLKTQNKNKTNIEGKLALGEIKVLNPHPFEYQFNETWLLCVCDPLAQQFEWGKAWRKINEHIQEELSNGEVLRLPLSLALEKEAFDQKELWQLLDTLQERDQQGFHHKILICTRLNGTQQDEQQDEQRDDQLLKIVLKRAMMLGILDGLACHAYDGKQVLAISEDYLLDEIQSQNFSQAAGLIDQAITALCQKNKQLSIQKMGEAVMKCSVFSGVFEFFRQCVNNQNFLLKQLYDELLLCLHANALERARLLSIAFLKLYDDPQLYQLSRQIDQLCKKSRRSQLEGFIAMGYFDHAKESLKVMRAQENLPLPPLIWHGYPKEDQRVEEEQLWAKWEQRIVKSQKNSILWLEIERACYLSKESLQSYRLSSELQAKLENHPNWLSDFLNHPKYLVEPSKEQKLTFTLNEELHVLMKISKSVTSFHPSFVEVWTYQALKFYFSKSSKEKLRTAILVQKTWLLLSETLKKHPTHQELLSYVGLMSLVLGNHHQMRQTFLFFDLFEQLSHVRLTQGPFSKLKVKLPIDAKQQSNQYFRKKFKKIEFELKAQSGIVQKAILEQESYAHQTRRLKSLCQSLIDEEKREVFALKSEIIEHWRLLGRNHLAELYTLALNEEWIYQVLLKEHPLKDLNIPFIGDLPIGTLWQFIQRIRFHWQQYRFKQMQLDHRFVELIGNLQKELRIMG